MLIKRASKSTVGESGVSIMSGSYGANYTPVALDASGNMQAVLVGASSVTASGTTDIRGADGATSRAIAVDGSGRLISLMSGSVGASVIPILVDAGGRMIALMSGSYTSTISPISLDDQGRMLGVMLSSGSHFEQWSSTNVNMTASTHVWSSKAYSILINNQGPYPVHLNFDGLATNTNYPIAAKYGFGGDIQHTYVSLVASTETGAGYGSTVYAMVTW